MDLNKITSLDEAVKTISGLKSAGRRIVFCYGLFNFLHIGHIRFLKEAKEHGDVLVVGICSDRYAEDGPGGHFEEHLRAEAISSLDWVDLVVVNPYEKIHPFVQRIGPHLFVKGFESKDNSRLKGDHLDAKAFRDMGVELVVLEENHFVSTRRINRYMGNMPDVVRKYLQLFSRRFSRDEVVRAVERMGDLRVLVVGDTILDEYQYCSVIGKSSKDPMLALKYESHDLFAGGVLSIANHVAGFADRVDLVTILGEERKHESFIRSNLNPGVDPTFFSKPNAPTLIKRRFVDGYSMNKLFEIYLMDDSAIEGELETRFWKHIEERLDAYDLVIAADFGHGTISEKVKRLLSEKAPYLAVNAQSNAGNRGFNNITKYPHAHYVSIAEHELRTEMRDMSGKMRNMMETLVEKLACRRLTVTRGRHGCMVMDQRGDFVQVPSFATKVVDRVGAGDALFAMTSLVAVQDVPAEIIGFLGNVAGSLAVEIMGNQKSICREMALDYVKRLMTADRRAVV